MNTVEKQTVSPENAPKFLDWLANRGGIAVWRSINLSNPGASWSTPAKQLDGTPTQKPTWQAANEPESIIADASEIDVVTDREIKRFHVAVKRGDSFNFVCTDASTAKIRREVDKAGDGASYVFDHETQEAVILAPNKIIPLSEWKA